MSVNQKYALITGATSGIGYELAKLFAKDRYNLVIVARSEEELNSKAVELRQQGIEVC
jgi:short-subunit dehydrogenase